MVSNGDKNSLQLGCRGVILQISLVSLLYLTRLNLKFGGNIVRAFTIEESNVTFFYNGSSNGSSCVPWVAPLCTFYIYFDLSKKKSKKSPTLD
jgi:hypothetical protein